MIDAGFSKFDEIIISGGALGVQLFITPENFVKATNAKAEHIAATAQ